MVTYHQLIYLRHTLYTTEDKQNELPVLPLANQIASTTEIKVSVQRKVNKRLHSCRPITGNTIKKFK